MVERCQHLAYLRVHVGDVGEIAVADFSGFFGREGHLVGRNWRENKTLKVRLQRARLPATE